MTPQEQIARMRAQLIARYRLRDVPGRPEELVQAATDKRVSLAYASQSVRIRLQQGTRWLNRVDFPVRDGDGWKSGLFELTDPHFTPGSTPHVSPPRQSPTIDVADRHFPVSIEPPRQKITPEGVISFGSPERPRPGGGTLDLDLSRPTRDIPSV